MSSLVQAHADLYLALNAMLNGDSAPIMAVWSEGDDVSYAGPFGGAFLGRDSIAQEFDRAAALHLGGKIEVSDIHMVEAGDMGFSFCVEHGIDHTQNGQIFSITHRATNVFRREVGGWRLVHHHTDQSGA